MADFKKLERLLKAVANRRRLAILAFLQKEHETSVGKIAGHIKISLKATSKHLTILHAADLVDRNQRSLEMHYQLNPTPRLLEVLYSTF